MQEIRGDLFSRVIPGTNFQVNAICVTTNGFVKKDGCCVMGRGSAAEAKNRWPGLDLELGRLIQARGNSVHIVRLLPEYSVLSFPVKPCWEEVTRNSLNVVPQHRRQFPEGSIAPGWACMASPSIIRTSCKELVGLTNQNHWNVVVLPRPGCGAGALLWNDVKPILCQELDGRFYVISR